MTWQDRARCAEPDIDRNWFFPSRRDHEKIKKALATCEQCPVLTECRAYAHKHEDYGIWGGLILTLEGEHQQKRPDRIDRRLRSALKVDREKIIERWRNGQSLDAIAAEYGVTRRSIRRTISDAA